MFTVPDKYVDDKKLELMMKEISSLIFRVCKYYMINDTSNINIQNLSFFIKKTPHKKWTKYDVDLNSENFKLTFMVNQDGFVYTNCSAYLNSQECSQEDILFLAKKTNILDLLREKLSNNKANFIN